MNVHQLQFDSMALPERMHKRLSAIGVTTVRLTPDGTTQTIGDSRWIERVIVQSSPLRAVVQKCWAELTRGDGQAVSVWPGLWLVPFPKVRRRRITQTQGQQVIYAAVLLGDELAHSDQLRLVCDTCGYDYASVERRIDVNSLYRSEAVSRMAAMIGWMHQDSTELSQSRGEIDGMSQELAESYEELSLLYKLSSNMAVNQPPRSFLIDACHELQQVVSLRWMALQLSDEPRLEELAAGFFHAGTMPDRTDDLRRIGSELMARYGKDTEPTVIDDTRTLDIKGLKELTSSLLVIPLFTETTQLGILFGGEKLDGTHLSSVDSKLCNSLANSLSIFLDNRMLYDDMHAMFLGTLHALTRAIDAKDSYTHGHSERVALMSRQLAEAAGLDEHTCERVYIAGLVHDVGKIGVPEHVLCKPGKLTDDEFGLIKKHPEIGASILSDIRQMQDLIPGVLHHHERWDGRGYPYGLEGNDVPLFGKLIGLADSFDAMSSDRTYRKGMGRERVLAEIERCGGSQFDPALAKVFLKLDFKPYDEMIEKHQNEQVHTTT